MINKNKFLSRMVMSGYSQRSLAKAVGLSKNTINQKVNGHGYFDTEQIDRICSVLGITSGAEKAEIFLSSPSQKRDDNKPAS